MGSGPGEVERVGDTAERLTGDPPPETQGTACKDCEQAAHRKLREAKEQMNAIRETTNDHSEHHLVGILLFSIKSVC